MAKKKKDKQKPRKPKSKLNAQMPRPKPVTMRGPRYYLERAREYPIFGSWVMEGWQESGITPVVIARQQSPDKVIFATYLVDFYCLGVKDALCNADFPLKRFNNNLPRLCSGKPEACDIGLAHELVYGAIDFARRYGFEPHPDFSLASNVLDPPGTHASEQQLEFGKDGKPFLSPGRMMTPKRSSLNLYGPRAKEILTISWHWGMWGILTILRTFGSNQLKG